MLAPLTASNLSPLAGIAHGFFTRQGGVSGGIYGTLNCGPGSDDDPDAVSRNRARVAAHLGASGLVTAHQIHSATAIVAEAPWTTGARPKADAIVTRTPGLAVGALSADCAPVLLADPQARVVAAAHAGWRGAVGGILEATVAQMVSLGARRENIRAAVGPTIGAAVYEVGPDFQTQVLAVDAAAADCFHEPRPGARVHFDLPRYVALRLRRAQIMVAEETPPCTYEANRDFFSFRRSQALKEPDYGRQISAIVLT
ncbi:MAG: peptidoglycan editing factor PgeF [Hyphomicrobiaceae bacterium]|nr:peptidoglycan editing factor PgeF [Hyphomicrobiaceae bacterium]